MQQGSMLSAKSQLSLKPNWRPSSELPIHKSALTAQQDTQPRVHAVSLSCAVMRAVHALTHMSCCTAQVAWQAIFWPLPTPTTKLDSLRCGSNSFTLPQSENSCVLLRYASAAASSKDPCRYKSMRPPVDQFNSMHEVHKSTLCNASRWTLGIVGVARDIFHDSRSGGGSDPCCAVWGD